MTVPRIEWNKIETIEVWFGEVMDDDDDDSSPHENSYFVNILNSDFTALALFWSTKISLACVYEQSDECFYIIRNFKI